MSYEAPSVVVVAEATKVILGVPSDRPEDNPPELSTIPGQLLGFGLD